MTRHEREAAERFKLLVAHPYGMSAMESLYQSAWANYWREAFMADRDKCRIFMERAIERSRLAQDIEEARARVRGRA